MSKWVAPLAVVLAVLLAALAAWWIIAPGGSPRVPALSGVKTNEASAAEDQPLVNETTPEDQNKPPRELGNVVSDEDLRRNPAGLVDPVREAKPRKLSRPRTDADETSSPHKSNRRVIEYGEGLPPRTVVDDEGVQGPWSLPGPAPESEAPSLLWLNAAQGREGCWSDGTTVDQNGEPAGNVFTSAIALLANLRTGASHKQGATRAEARLVVLWSRKLQANDGNFASTEKTEPVLHHSAALLALAEAYGDTGDQVLKPIVDKGVDYLEKARSELGGWGMTANAINPNATATGWALLALQRARQAGILVDGKLFDDAALWAWTLRRNEFVAWSSYADVMPVDTGVVEDGAVADAVFVLALAWGGYEVADDPYAERVVARLTNAPAWDPAGTDLMAWFFTSVALHVVATAAEAEWNGNVLDQLNTAGVVETNDAGEQTQHWTSDDYWSRRLGPAYTTAMASILQSNCAPAEAK